MMKKSMKSKIALAIMAASIMVTGCGNGTSMVGVTVTNSSDEMAETKSDTPEETTLQKTAPETDMNSEDEQAETDLSEAKQIEFVDRQGTPDIYSELTLDQVEGEDFLASIGLYRLTTFDGKAVRIDDNLFEFEDDTVDVKGLIRITDDGEGATFEVTESTWNYVHEGDIFYFLERL